MARVQRTAAVAAAAALSAAGVSSAQVSVSTDNDAEVCRVVRILANGRRVVTRSVEGDVAASFRMSDRGRGPRNSSSASASSSVSSSSVNGRTVSSASARTNGRGRTVTTTRDEDGCTVVIDERTLKGTQR